MREFLWYPQLDLYDTIRRLLLLVQLRGPSPFTRERLLVSDFFLASPSLLHRTRMTQPARDAFRHLRMEQDEFIDFPPAPVLFDKMAGVQSEAFHNLVGRGMLRLDLLPSDDVKLSQTGEAIAREARPANPTEQAVAEFLVGPFTEVGVGPGGLRAATGLRRIGL